jgi:hypothetical protein
MNIRHVIALALVGWYLMVPPTVPNTNEVDKTAPVKQWTIRRSFPHSQGCEMARDKVRQAALQNLSERDSTARRGRRDPEAFCPLCVAQCVSQDDPRLAH